MNKENMLLSKKKLTKLLNKDVVMYLTENGKLCGMLSLGDLALKEESSIDAGDALTEISDNLSSRY